MPGVVIGDHLRKRQIEPRRSADASGWRLSRRGIDVRGWLPHEGVKCLLDPAVEYLVHLVPGVLKLHDVHVLTEPLSKKLDRVHRRPGRVRRVYPDDARDARRMTQRHLPDDKSAPVVADENRFFDSELVKQTYEIAGQVLDIISLYGVGPIGQAIAALIRCDHPNAGLAQRLDLVTP